MHGLQKSEEEMKHKEGVLLDTSFLLRFLNEEDPLFTHADKYFEHFIKSGTGLYISVVSIARIIHEFYFVEIRGVESRCNSKLLQGFCNDGDS